MRPIVGNAENRNDCIAGLLVSVAIIAIVFWATGQIVEACINSAEAAINDHLQHCLWVKVPVAPGGLADTLWRYHAMPKGRYWPTLVEKVMTYNKERGVPNLDNLQLGRDHLYVPIPKSAKERFEYQKAG